MASVFTVAGCLNVKGLPLAFLNHNRLILMGYLPTRAKHDMLESTICLWIRREIWRSRRCKKSAKTYLHRVFHVPWVLYRDDICSISNHTQYNHSGKYVWPMTCIILRDVMRSIHYVSSPHPASDLTRSTRNYTQEEDRGSPINS